MEWARVLGVEPTIKAVGTYITKLHPVTLTRDTRVTNHSFVNGRAVGYQAILAAGTSVLVDDYGNPVVRCRCGNPLLKPIFIPTAVCVGCPPRYTPPPACPYTEEITYRRRWYPGRYYSNAAVRRDLHPPLPQPVLRAPIRIRRVVTDHGHLRPRPQAEAEAATAAAATTADRRPRATARSPTRRPRSRRRRDRSVAPTR